jgi:hypothetical protein
MTKLAIAASAVLTFAFAAARLNRLRGIRSKSASGRG